MSKNLLSVGGGLEAKSQSHGGRHSVVLVLAVVVVVGRQQEVDPPRRSLKELRLILQEGTRWQAYPK
jgi:hypothetical protein